MAVWAIDPALAVGEARALYFAQAGFKPDGGYGDRWVWLKFGPIPLAIPNTRSRRAAVPLHDIHHLVTDYATSWQGEAEISAWEIGAGCGRYSFAWLINLQGMVMGWFVNWRATWRAFVRGRHSRSLYTAGYSDAVLREPVSELRSRLGLDRPAPTPRASDYLSYALWCGIAELWALVTIAPLWIPIAWLLRRWLAS